MSSPLASSLSSLSLCTILYPKHYQLLKSDRSPWFQQTRQISLYVNFGILHTSMPLSLIKVYYAEEAACGPGRRVQASQSESWLTIVPVVSAQVISLKVEKSFLFLRSSGFRAGQLAFIMKGILVQPLLGISNIPHIHTDLISLTMYTCISTHGYSHDTFLRPVLSNQLIDSTCTCICLRM